MFAAAMTKYTRETNVSTVTFSHLKTRVETTLCISNIPQTSGQCKT